MKLQNWLFRLQVLGSLVACAIAYRIILGVPSATRQDRVGLRGVILHAVTDAPLAGISFTVGGIRTVSGAEGRFDMPGLLPGRYRVVSRTGRYLFAHGPEESQGPFSYRQEGVYLTITADQDPIVLRMLEAPVVRGRAVDPFGNPLQGVIFTRHQVIYDLDGTKRFLASPSGSTDDRGEFSLPLPPGEYVFSLQKNTNPLDAFQEEYYPRGFDTASPATIILRSEDLDLGTIVLSSVSGTTVNLRLQDASGKSIGSGFSGLIIRPQGGLMTRMLRGPTASLQLPPGVYDIEGSAQLTGGVGIQGRATIQVADRDMVWLIPLSPGVQVIGRVVKREIDSTLTAMAGVQVGLRELHGLRESRFKTKTEKDGSFMLSSLAEGDYQILFPLRGDDVGIDFLDSEVLTAPDLCVSQILLNDAPLLLRQARIRQNAQISIEVRDKAALVEGVVVYPDDSPVPGAVVALIPENRQDRTNYSATTADQFGKFQLACSPPGNYQLYAWSELPGAAYRNDEFMDRYRDKGVSVVLREDRLVSMRIPLSNQ